MPAVPEPAVGAEAWLEHIRQAADKTRASDLARQAIGSPGIDAPAFLQALKDASKAMLTVEPSRAVVLAEGLLAGADAAGLPWFRALGRMARGDAYGAQGGRVADAVAELDAAAEAFHGLGDDVAWARTRIGWIYYRGLSGLATEEDLSIADRARGVLAGAGEGKLAVVLDRNMMLCHWHRGQLDRAEACFARAMATVDGPEGTPVSLEVAWLRANRGLMLTSQARLAEALDEHLRALALFERFGQRESLRRQEHNLGHLCLAMGDHGQALTHFYSGLALAEADGLALPRGLVLANIARCHLALGGITDGVSEAREALTVLRRQGADAEALRCSLVLAQGLSAIGTTEASDEAERILRTCLADPRLPELRAHDGMVRLDLAELALRRGDVQSASRWSGEAQERFRSGDLGLLVLVADLVAAEADLMAGRTEAANQAASASREAARHRGLTALLPRSWHLTAKVAQAEDRPAAAREAFEEAMDSLDGQLERLPPLLRTHVMDDRWNLMADALSCYRRSAGVDDLWWMLERTKAQASHLVDAHRLPDGDAIADRSAGSSPTISGLTTRLYHVQREQSQLFGLRHAPDWLPSSSAALSSSPVDLATLDQRLAELETDIVRLHEQLALSGWTPAVHAGAVRRRDAWSPPRPSEDVVLASFGLAATEAFVLLARGDHREAVVLPLDTAQLTSLAGRWHEAVEDACAELTAGLPAAKVAAPLNALLRRLHAALIAPWQDWLSGASRVVILPHGALHALPYGALHDGTQHLVALLEVGVAPSIAWWEACCRRRTARSRGLVAAFSHDGALPGAAAEARRIGDLLGLSPLLESEATPEAVLRAAEGAGLIHLAAHAATRPDRPTFSHLWLAGGGLLSSHDLAALDLRGALVTLSGCETGQGRLTGADEVLSLSRACLNAGAATVLGTLWPLRDAAALPLMTTIYEGLQRGLTVGAALRAAQTAALRGDWPCPLDWAAFQCLGSCDTMLPTAWTQEVIA